MIESMFECLEGRRLMSMSAVASVPDAPENDWRGQVEEAVSQYHVTAPIRRAVSSPTVNVSKLVGKFREKTSSILFVSKIAITSVDANGVVKGKLSIPWIVSNAKVTGKITKDGKFRLNFKASDGTTGYFNGKMSANGKMLKGWMDYDWNGKPGTGSSAFQQTFDRWGK
jgi:hypothetical protein